MFFFKWVVTCLKKAFRGSLKAIVLAGYDDSTICNFFRRRGAQIGEDTHICTKSIGTPYLVRIGNHVWISYDVVFHSHDGGTWVLTEKYPHIDVFGAIIIEDNCIIGKGAQLLPNIRIGRNSIVGAGSVVISDVPPNSIVMGVPARPIGSLAKYEEKCLALWKEQIPPGMDPAKDNWFRSKKKYKRFKEHLINLYMNREKEPKENIEEPSS
jgi:acetyltransferase-like isoleucine patch superfamily enzyme